MNRLPLIVMNVFFVLLSLTRAGFAEENEVLALKNEVQILNGRVAELESLMKNMQGHISGAQGKEFTSPQAVEPGQKVPGGFVRTMAEDIHLGGYVDVQYNNNFGKETTNLGGTPLRSFDGNQNTFQLNAANLTLQKEANPKGGIGFRTDILIGNDARIIDTAVPGTSSTDLDKFAIEQAYAELVTPLKFLEGNNFLGDTVKLKAGRFVTLAGAEVIDPRGNWNISRSLLFTLSAPFTHTGARAEYGLFNNRATVYLGAVNGWDEIIDNNSFKTLESGISLKPLENVTWTTASYFGPENPSQSGHKRFLMTNAARWDITKKLSAMGEIDFGTERRVPGLLSHDFESADWHGYAGYLRYQLTDTWASAYRVEFFRDDEGFRSVGVANSTGQDNLWEQTLTLERHVSRQLRVPRNFPRDDCRGYENADRSTAGGG